MANLTPKKIVLSEINNGQQIENGDGVQPNLFNAPVEASAYAQALATTQPNLENVNNFGTPSVSIEEVDGLPRFKFENLNAVEISKVEQTVSSTESGGENVLSVYLNNGDVANFSVYNGKTGAKLVSRVLQGQDQDGGNIYLDTFDDGTTAYFTAPRGRTADKISDWMGTEQIGSPTNPLYYDGEKFTQAYLFEREITLETASWDFIASVAEAGTASQYFKIGEMKSVLLRNGVTVYVSISSFGTATLKDGTSKKGIRFYLVDLYEKTSFSGNKEGNSSLFPSEVTMYAQNILWGSDSLFSYYIYFPIRESDLTTYTSAIQKQKYLIEQNGTQTPCAWWLYEGGKASNGTAYGKYITSNGVIDTAYDNHTIHTGEEDDYQTPKGRCFGFFISK